MCLDSNLFPVIFVSRPKASAARAYAQFKPCLNALKLKFKKEFFFFLKQLEIFQETPDLDANL
jgi:predicted peroxiredoxin